MHIRFMDSIKSFEGFTQKANWDYSQHTNGFGTKALYPGESISVEEANRRFEVEINEARRFVEAQAEGWDDGTKAALTSLTFNAGTRWATSGLGDAIRRFDIDAVRSHFLQYNKAGGEVLPGLVKRRLTEVTWIGEGLPSQSTLAAQSAPVATPVSVEDPKRPPPSTALSEHAGMAKDTNSASTPHHPERPPTIEDTSAGRALSVAWILLSLDMATLNSRSERDRENSSYETL